MKPKASFVEVVHPAALMSDTLDYLALIILDQPQEGILHELSLLQPHEKYKIGVIERSSSDTVEEYIQKARKFKIPSIFVQPQPPSFSQVTENHTALSVNVISPGSCHSNDLAAQFITHPRTANVSWIGYQTYFTPPELLLQLQARYFSSLRLGSYRENFKAAEPLIRSNRLHFMDLTAIRHSDAPESSGRGPNGLYADEICQLARYIGVSSHLDGCFMYGFPKKIKSAQIITQLIAQILWHLFESLSARQNEDPCDPNHQIVFSAKEVYIGDHDHILYFLYSNQTGRWWMRLESTEGIPSFIPCMHEDYAMALKGELPVTWLRHYQKLNLL